MRMSDCETMDDILSEFANRNPAGYVVWGQKILAAHNRECEQLNAEIEAMSKFNDSLNAQMKECDTKYEKLRALVKDLADALFEMNNLGCLFCTSLHKIDCMKGDYCDRKVRNNALVAKARKEVKDGK